MRHTWSIEYNWRKTKKNGETLTLWIRNRKRTIIFGCCFGCMRLYIHGFLWTNRFHFDGVQFVVSGSHFHRNKNERNKSTFSLDTTLINMNFCGEIGRFYRFGILTLTKRCTKSVLNNYIFIFSMVFQLNFMKTFFFLVFHFSKDFFLELYLTTLSTVKLSVIHKMFNE